MFLFDMKCAVPYTAHGTLTNSDMCLVGSNVIGMSECQYIPTHTLPIAPFYVVRKKLKKTQWGRTVATIVLTSNTTCGHKSPIPASSPRPSFYIEISHRRKEVKQRISGVPENEDCANFSFH